ncbi:threonine aldolase family protein [Allonocardiopsis opalescens]|uniref:L-threonine aldolase n=1 Tax=Allonocardiopsis opalescens TaxID=1144618 RepID=A0A2T0QF64_9ACTN|nr:GntG family PLP-dependent aldolase [Allonocardiopsis opalescens]PRY02577.1 L-threonine aldolase [Allonocardiopsis opalescens]
MIDLRSDTVTRPTDAMRRAMYEAETGDDVYGEDPTVNRLEAEVAELTGFPAALYVPSGSMANQLAVYAAIRSGDEVWTHVDSHVSIDEQGGVAVLARGQLRTFTGPGPAPSTEWLEDGLRERHDIHRAPPRLISLENTFGGTVVPVAEQRRVADFARANGLLVHLDGARLWNAATALGLTPAETARGADSLAVCFSKGLGAPVGSALCGGADTIARARRARKLLGGGMRQAGVIAAGALYALRHHRGRLADDHRRARALAEGIAELPGLSVDLAAVHTNMVFVGVPRGRTDAYLAAFREHGVAAGASYGGAIRLVTHLDLGDADITAAVDAIAKAAAALA